MHFGAIVDEADVSQLLPALYDIGGEDPFILSDKLMSIFTIPKQGLQFVDNWVAGEELPDPWVTVLSWHNNRAGDVPTQCLIHESTSLGRISGVSGSAKLCMFMGNATQWHELRWPNPFNIEPIPAKRTKMITTGKEVDVMPWRHGGFLTLHQDGTITPMGGAPHFGNYDGEVPAMTFRYRAATGPSSVPGYPEGITVFDTDLQAHQL